MSVSVLNLLIADNRLKCGKKFSPRFLPVLQAMLKAQVCLLSLICALVMLRENSYPMLTTIAISPSGAKTNSLRALNAHSSFARTVKPYEPNPKTRRRTQTSHEPLPQ